MGQRYLFLFAFLCTMVWPGQRVAAAVASLFTAEDVSVSNLSLASTVVGRADHLGAASVNPAAINSNYYMSAYAFQKLGFGGNNSTYLSYALKQWEYNFAVNAGVAHPVSVEEINDFGESVGSASVYDFYFSLLAGRENKINYSYLKGRLSYGGGIKVLQSKLFDTSVTVPAIDAGFNYHFKIPQLVFLPNYKPENFSLGLSLLNLGPPVTYQQTSNSQPLSINTGFAYDIFAIKRHEVALLSALNIRSQVATVYGIALEYLFYSVLKARLGYSFGDQKRSFAAGMGFKYSYQKVYDFDLDYSFGLNSSVQNEHYLGATVKYNKGLIQNKLARVEKSTRKVNREIDAEILDMYRQCIKEYQTRYEQNPSNLDQMQNCYQTYGFQGKPETMAGVVTYDYQSAKVELVENSSFAENYRDQLILADGTTIKGRVVDSDESQVILLKPSGRLTIERNLVSYAVLAHLPASDKNLLYEVRQLVNEIKNSSGTLPGDFEEIKQYFKLKKGVEMPSLSRGQFAYDQKTGETQVVERYSL